MNASSTPPIALSIAGSDSSGGAGIQADLKTFSALGVVGATVVTALTAQNSLGVTGIHTPPTTFAVLQLEAVLSDLDVRAVKIGMLGEAELIDALADRLAVQRHNQPSLPIVLDPVMVATTGAVLVPPTAIKSLQQRLIPMATLITPNVPEAAVLLDLPSEAIVADPTTAARRLLDEMGARAVLLKGGHGTTAECADVWLTRDGDADTFTVPRVPTPHTHGSGCTLSSAIAAFLAHGLPLRESIGRAKTYVTNALIAADRLRVGHGHGPLHHFAAWW